MRRLFVYLLPDGTVVTRLQTIDQQNRQTVDSWATHRDGEPVFVGQPPFEYIHLLRTIEISNEPSLASITR